MTVRSVTAPTTITGTVSGGDWKLEHSLADTSDPSRRVWTQFSNGSGATSGNLGSLDTTLMLNGLYDVRLTTTDQYGQISTDTISLTIENNLKVGHFTVSFDDMTVPVNGVPMQIVRTYDSRDKRPGDFGIGWTLSIKNIRIEKNRTIGLNWRQTSNGALFPTYCVEATRPHIVTVTMPDGTVEKFNAKLRQMCQQYAPVDYSYVEFQPEPGTRGKLEVVGDNYVAVVGSVPGPMEFVGFNGQGIFDSASFKYTSKDGTQFTLRQGVGLEMVRDLDGNTLTIDANGIHHSSGASIAFTRDTFGRITNVTDPAGEDNVYGYDASGDLVSFTDREDNETTFTYEPLIPHHLKSIVDPLGRTPIRNDYDASGRLLKHTDAEGNEIEYTHDLAARVETIKDRLGNPTVYEYDGRGNVLKKRDALNHETTYSYDANDNMLTETNALGKTTTYTYDLFDNRTSVTDPLNNKTEFTYNNLGQPLTVKDARGKITTNTYSPSGQLLTTTDPLGRTTTNIYSLQTGLQTRMLDALQHETQYEYTNNRLTSETDPQGNVTTYGYGANGNRTTQTVRRTNALGQIESITTTFLYDKLNRVTKTTYADNSFTRVEYNELGQQKATIDQAGHRTEFEYDTLGRLIKTTHPDGKFEESTYDDEGRRLTSKDRAGRITSFEYDVLGRLKKTTYADGTFTTTNYDAAGQVETSTDARNNTTTFTYDDAGRRLTVKNALDQVTSFVYDAKRKSDIDDRRSKQFDRLCLRRSEPPHADKFP
jgi:YD repeat-containing protein